MDFDLTEEQRLLQESVGKLIAAHYMDSKIYTTHQAAPGGFSRVLWDKFAEAGLLALPFAETDGGFGAGPIEAMLVMEQFGAALALEPYLTSSIMCGALLRDGASPEMKADLLPRVISGETLLAPAYVEPGTRGAVHEVSLAAAIVPNGYILNGRKSVVLGGGAADAFLVATRTTKADQDKDGLTLMLVDAATPGLSRQTYPTQDGCQVAELEFANVWVPAANILGREGHGLTLLNNALEEAIAALCAEAVGAMEALFKLTIDYLKTRRQFGVTLGSFQALQHHVADMYMALEQARSMAIYAALAITDHDPVKRSAAIAAAKVQTSQSARFIGETATQLHGGIGLTNEYKGGHYFKRLTMIAYQFGDAGVHLRQLARNGGLIPAETV